MMDTKKLARSTQTSMDNISRIPFVPRHTTKNGRKVITNTLLTYLWVYDSLTESKPLKATQFRI